MRPLIAMDTIQIEVTNFCHHKCSNCTRLVGHHPKPYFMDMDYFKKAVDSMIDYPKMTGIMGGEPLLHPKFKEMCEYLHSKVPPEKCGLWSCFPNGLERYREVIAETFGHIFLNDQSRDDILHGPVLVASEEMTEISEDERWRLIDNCWVQNYWSAAINPHGGFFCEIAASLSMLFDDGKPIQAWDIEPGWWKKIPKDFKEQMEKYCIKCGAAMPLKKRVSIDGLDDISVGMLKALEKISPKLKKGDYVINDLKQEIDQRQTATYKDRDYRDNIADRYGMFLTLNKQGFQTPHLKSDWRK